MTNMSRRIVFLSSFLLLVVSLINAQPMQVDRITETITLDGYLTEAAWQSLQPLPLVMFTPTHRGLMTERTEIRVAYDDRFLYVGMHCYDSDSAGVQANSMARDGMSSSDDFCGILLDTFNDNENAVTFMTTPSGLREDRAVFNDGEPLFESYAFTTSWNTFWDVAVSRTKEGWFGEMRIPLSSLRFDVIDGDVVMGFMAWRWLARKNEVQSFPDLSPDWANATLKPSLAKKIILKGISRENLVYATPYVLGGVGTSYNLNENSTEYLRSKPTNRELGLDLKYGISSNLTLDLTLNTDFAQVEADDQLVNLTRFSLFFPEKRLFFQERASIFDVPMGGSVRLFHSRQIGLSEGGPVRIYGGARVVGRVGTWDLGFLDMQTAESADLPSENFGILRLRKRVLNQNSYVGTLLTSRIGNNGAFNYAYAFDGLIRAVGDDYVQFNWAQTFDSDLVKPRHRTGLNVARILLNWTKRISTGFGYEFDLSRSGQDFDPGIGFAPRVNYTRFGDRLFYGWLMGDSSPIYSQVITFRANAFLNNNSHSVESSEMGAEWSVNMKSGAFGQLSVKHFKESLTEFFELSNGVDIPAGIYSFYNVGLVYQTPWGQLLQSAINLDVGSFYDGNRISIGFAPYWSVSQYLEMTFNYQFNRLRFAQREQELDDHLGRIRMRATLSTEFTATTFVQYNSASNAVVMNFRLRYNPKEGTDLYIVYNETFNTNRYRELPHLPYNESRTILAKFSTTFLF